MVSPRSPSSSALRAPDEIEEPPALLLAQGARLHEADHVAHLALVLLVVDLEPAPPADVLAVLRVLHQHLDRDDHRLLPGVAHDRSGHDLPPAAGFGLLLDHALASP